MNSNKTNDPNKKVPLTWLLLEQHPKQGRQLHYPNWQATQPGSGRAPTLRLRKPGRPPPTGTQSSPAGSARSYWEELLPCSGSRAFGSEQNECRCSNKPSNQYYACVYLCMLHYCYDLGFLHRMHAIMNWKDRVNYIVQWLCRR